MSKDKHKDSPSLRQAFPGQHEGEEVELVFHQHPLVMRKAFIVGLLIVLAGLGPFSLIIFFPDQLYQFEANLLNVFWLACTMVAAYWFYNWIGWYYSVYIVTNERIVEVKQKGFFNRRVTEFGLDKIQNINYHIRGFQAVVFQFGDIIVQTYVGDLVMPTIYHPVKIHEKIVAIVRREVGSSAASDAQKVRLPE